MKIKIIFLTLCIFTGYTCMGQDKTKLIFVHKKDTTKKTSIALPFKAMIQPRHSLSMKDVIIINADDSSITALDFVLDRTTPLTETENSIVNAYWEEVSIIEDNKMLTPEEKKEQLSKADLLVYIDTVKFNLSDIKTIEYPKKKRSLLFRTSVSLLFLTSAIVTIGGGIISTPDSTSHLTKEQRQIAGIISVVGFIGYWACIVWMHNIVTQYIYVRKIFIKIERTD